MDINETQKYTFGVNREDYIRSVMAAVYAALSEKGYNPVSQLVGYIMSGDPTYITSHNNARALIGKIDRDELLEAMVKNYIDHNRA
ncbi:MAG: IreB family regulatory phosphoprotein [Ruminococcaceae bacterium]|nr:IreB family regulatory phosphoprotein [Oscillospiraceae bacterium]